MPLCPLILRASRRGSGHGRRQSGLNGKGPDDISRFPNDWYRTGDRMQQDMDGHYWCASRVKDLIIRGGSNISPIEVERVPAAAA